MSAIVLSGVFRMEKLWFNAVSTGSEGLIVLIRDYLGKLKEKYIKEKGSYFSAILADPVLVDLNFVMSVEDNFQFSLMLMLFLGKHHKTFEDIYVECEDGNKPLVNIACLYCYHKEGYAVIVLEPTDDFLKTLPQPNTGEIFRQEKRFLQACQDLWKIFPGIDGMGALTELNTTIQEIPAFMRRRLELLLNTLIVYAFFNKEIGLLRYLGALEQVMVDDEIFSTDDDYLLLYYRLRAYFAYSEVGQSDYFKILKTKHEPWRYAIAGQLAMLSGALRAEQCAYIATSNMSINAQKWPIFYFKYLNNDAVPLAPVLTNSKILTSDDATADMINRLFIFDKMRAVSESNGFAYNKTLVIALLNLEEGVDIDLALLVQLSEMVKGLSQEKFSMVFKNKNPWLSLLSSKPFLAALSFLQSLTDVRFFEFRFPEWQSLTIDSFYRVDHAIKKMEPSFLKCLFMRCYNEPIDLPPCITVGHLNFYNIDDYAEFLTTTLETDIGKKHRDALLAHHQYHAQFNFIMKVVSKTLDADAKFEALILLMNTLQAEHLDTLMSYAVVDAMAPSFKEDGFLSAMTKSKPDIASNLEGKIDSSDYCREIEAEIIACTLPKYRFVMKWVNEKQPPIKVLTWMRKTNLLRLLNLHPQFLDDAFAHFQHWQSPGAKPYADPIAKIDDMPDRLAWAMRISQFYLRFDPSREFTPGLPLSRAELPFRTAAAGAGSASAVESKAGEFV